MARFTATTQLDMQAFLLTSDFGGFLQNASASGNATRFTFTDTDQGVTESLVLTGTFENYMGDYPTTGQITRAQYSITGGENFTISGIVMTVEEFNSFVHSGDAPSLFAAVFDGNDTMNGSDFDDFLYGFAGNDTMNGRLGADILAGMSGDDRYIVDNAGDLVAELENEGEDLVVASIDYTLTADVENLRLTDGALAGTGNDLDNELLGSGAGNTLRGLVGNDILRGYSGADTLVGGSGNDILDGGVRKDTLTGNSGSDTFLFIEGDTQSSRGQADVITDFSRLQSDRIHLGGIDANANLEGNQRFSWVGNGAFTGVAGQLRYAQANGMTYVEGDTNGDMVADVVIALTGTLDLVSTDFAL